MRTAGAARELSQAFAAPGLAHRPAAHPSHHLDRYPSHRSRHVARVTEVAWLG